MQGCHTAEITAVKTHSSDAVKFNTNFDTVAKSNIAIEQESHLFEKD